MDVGSILLGGLGAAFVGVVSAFGVEWWRNQRTGRAACRATFMELASTIAFLEFAAEHQVHVPFSTSTWDASRSDLAVFLPPDDFIEVATVIGKIETVGNARVGMAPGANLDSFDVNAARMAAKGTSGASNILIEHGWPKQADREKLVKRMKEVLKKEEPAATTGPTERTSEV